MRAYKAVFEVGLATEVIADDLLQGNKDLAAAAFNACFIPSVAYIDPDGA